jgi:hypothetical protein
LQQAIYSTAEGVIFDINWDTPAHIAMNGTGQERMRVVTDRIKEAVTMAMIDMTAATARKGCRPDPREKDKRNVAKARIKKTQAILRYGMGIVWPDCEADKIFSTRVFLGARLAIMNDGMRANRASRS